MNLADLAELMGKSVAEVEAMLKSQDTIELKLTDGKQGSMRESGEIQII